jgi:ABC-type multidrug transport system fused ATPase/permease subunit
MSLFRIADLAAGRILIDGVDISTLPLQRLRGGLAIIPQNPVLFKGSLRSYIDPFDEYTDDAVWSAVVKAQMADSVKRLYAAPASSSSSSAQDKDKEKDKEGVFKYLSAQVSDSGDNLSVGERQMLVMARALLRGAKILVMDEASANIDRATEIKLQTILRKTFCNTTTLTIAHRVETILHCDRIMVMANGSVQEVDAPSVLLGREGSLFRALAMDAGVDVPPLQTK